MNNNNANIQTLLLTKLVSVRQQACIDKMRRSCAWQGSEFSSPASDAACPKKAPHEIQTVARRVVVLCIRTGADRERRRRMAQAARERQVKAQEIIEHDPYVKDLIRQYDAKIVPGSIQPT